MLRYSRPKSQHWGHGCERMLAVELLGKVDRFMRDQTRVVDGPANRQMLQLVWHSAPADAIAGVVDEIRKVLSPPTELTESPQPDLLGLMAAKRVGQVWDAALGSKRHRAVWTLTDRQLSAVAEWLDRSDAILAKGQGAAFVHKCVTYQWSPHLRGGWAEFPEPMLLGVVLSRPRHIQVPFQFYTAEHYWRVKKYLAEIGLAILLDKSVLPKGSLIHNTAVKSG